MGILENIIGGDDSTSNNGISNNKFEQIFQINASESFQVQLPSDINSYKIKAKNLSETYLELGEIWIITNNELLYRTTWVDGATDETNSEPKLTIEGISITEDGNSINVNVNNQNLFSIDVVIFN
jgi:hypothetical protein